MPEAIDHSTWSAIGLTLKLAGVSTLILLVLALPLAWWLARSRSNWRYVVHAVTALPLVLPPTVLGFYLLLAFGPKGWIGAGFLALFDSTLVFSFSGLVLGSCVYSLPFVVQPIFNAFAALGSGPFDVAATLGASPGDRFFRVALPLAKPGILTAAILGFAHTVGEFGVVLMIGGNIKGRTDVLAITIFEHVEALEYGQAHYLSAALLIFSFLVLLAVFVLSKQKDDRA